MRRAKIGSFQQTGHSATQFLHIPAGLTIAHVYAPHVAGGAAETVMTCGQVARGVSQSLIDGAWQAADGVMGCDLDYPKQYRRPSVEPMTTRPSAIAGEATIAAPASNSHSLRPVATSSA